MSNKKKIMQVEQIHAFYSGTVQGVGFRYRSRSLAKSLGLYGWVKNLSDGRVELVAQGKPEVLNDFLVRLHSSFDGYISSKQISKQSPDGSLNDFLITF